MHPIQRLKILVSERFIKMWSASLPLCFPHFNHNPYNISLSRRSTDHLTLKFHMQRANMAKVNSKRQTKVETVSADIQFISRKLRHECVPRGYRAWKSSRKACRHVTEPRKNGDLLTVMLGHSVMPRDQTVLPNQTYQMSQLGMKGKTFNFL